MGLLMAILTAPFAIMFLLVMLGAPALQDGAGNSISPPYFMLILLPIIYGIVFYLGSALICWVYNWVAKKTGGIEYQAE